MELKGSTGPRSTNTAYYKLVKHHGLVKAITSGDRQTGEAIIYTFSYTLKDCAVLKTQKKNNTGAVPPNSREHTALPVMFAKRAMDKTTEGLTSDVFRRKNSAA
uniref:Lipocalin n=1 Tax=Rhipicephalus zambeziensis TaxID=60191 RepID=A0A224YNA9_9ACAR